MNLNIESIAIITDKDFGIKEKNNIENPIMRFGASEIVIDEDERIAILNK